MCSLPYRYKASLRNARQRSPKATRQWKTSTRWRSCATTSRTTLCAVLVRQLPTPFYQLCVTLRTSISHTLRIRGVLQAYVRIFSHTRSSTSGVRAVQPAQEAVLSEQSPVLSSSPTALIPQNVSSAVLVWLSVSSVQLLRNDPV